MHEEELGSINTSSWEKAREELLEDSDRYREKHQAWKTSLYAGLLTVNGIYIAIAAFIKNENSLFDIILSSIISLLAVLSCIGITFNITVFIRLYDYLGYEKVPKEEKNYTEYEQKVKSYCQKFCKYREPRQFIDKFIIQLGFIMASVLIIIKVIITLLIFNIV
ncbi:MAG: hypothetical protein PHO00_02335 [bacterium]|nr:hypothetical protein [bacterium]